MLPVEVVFAIAQFARIGAWVMTLFLAGAALAILAFGAGDYASVPDRQRAGVTVLGLAILVVILAAIMGPLSRRIAEYRLRP